MPLQLTDGQSESTWLAANRTANIKLGQDGGSPVGSRNSSSSSTSKQVKYLRGKWFSHVQVNYGRYVFCLLWTVSWPLMIHQPFVCYIGLDPRWRLELPAFLPGMNKTFSLSRLTAWDLGMMDPFHWYASEARDWAKQYWKSKRRRISGSSWRKEDTLASLQCYISATVFIPRELKAQWSVGF